MNRIEAIQVIGQNIDDFPALTLIQAPSIVPRQDCNQTPTQTCGKYRMPITLSDLFHLH